MGSGCWQRTTGAVGLLTRPSRDLFPPGNKRTVAPARWSRADRGLALLGLILTAARCEEPGDHFGQLGPPGHGLSLAALAVKDEALQLVAVHDRQLHHELIFVQVARLAFHWATRSR